MRKKLRNMKKRLLPLCLSIALVTSSSIVAFATDNTNIVSEPTDITQSIDKETDNNTSSLELSTENNDIYPVTPELNDTQSSIPEEEKAIIEVSNEDTTTAPKDTEETFSEVVNITPENKSDTTTPTGADAKIHFLTLNAGTLAVLLECNGHFGMIDSGEDNDYPSGDDPMYPFRDGTTIGGGFEDQVIEYLHEVGVNKENFDFYIGTHPHSDHIGSADEIIREFHPKRVYTPEYHDRCIKAPWMLFDNLYIYDRLITAADEVGASLILRFDPNAPIEPNNTITTFSSNGTTADATLGLYENISSQRNVVGNPNFTLGGDMEIQIKNYDTDYLYSPKADANDFSLGVLVKANGKTAFISGDLGNYDGDEDRLIKELPHIDIYCVGHHGMYPANSYNFINHISPSVMVVPGKFNSIPTYRVDYSTHTLFETLTEQVKKGVPLYTTGGYSAYIPAIVFNMNDELSHNMPEGVQYMGKLRDSDTFLSFKDGHFHKFTGDLPYDDKMIHFEDSYMSGVGTFVYNNKWQFLLSDATYARNQYVNYNGTIYYFDGNANMYTGWKSDVDPESGKTIWKYFNNSGAMSKGWIYINNSYYYLSEEDGVMQTGFQMIGNDIYFFNDSGSMVSNTWEYYDNHWYYLTKSGAAAKGFLYLNGVWYYLNPNTCIMQTGWVLTNGVWYYLNGSGAMLTGWQLINGSWYYLNSSGAMLTGWLHLGSAWYYLDSSGAMKTGWQLINNCWYYLNSSGVMLTGWQLINGSWYYLNGSGAMQTDWLYSGRTWYYLDSSGAMKTGWQFIDDYWYYLDGSGAMKTGWIHSGKTWYYLNSSGQMLTNTTVDGYTLDENGAMI